MIDTESDPGSWARDIARRPAAPVAPQEVADLMTFQPSPERDRWWAERWLKSATPGARAAMRELLSL